ncbi:hypothetical protein L0Y41_02310 [bacterium]|nr:hypothetical protein [bacterium]
MDVYIDGKVVRVNPASSIGKGGEADIFKIGSDTALKLYKQPNHPDIIGIADPKGRAREIAGAKRRIEEHQQKLPSFPKNLPPRVIAPIKLARAGREKLIAGYTMQLVSNAEPLISYGSRTFRETIANDQITTAVFKDLLKTVDRMHDAGLVIGDFNDLNVLVRGEEAYLLDVDSAQFGRFYCRVFTAKFVDPTLCDSSRTTPLLVKPHNEQSDWYALSVMFMQSFLFVGPYGGVYKPVDKTKRIPHDARPLHRISVFNSEVQYPKPARPLDTLPDSVLAFFKETFENDRRGAFPMHLIERLQFDGNGRILATVKPIVTPAIIKEVHTGTVSAEKIFSTTGRILNAAYQSGRLYWLYHDSGTYKREDGTEVIQGPYDPHMRYRVQQKNTVLAKGTRVFVFSPGKRSPQEFTVETYGQLPLIDTNEHTVYFVESGILQRVGLLGPLYAERIGDVLSAQTLFWAGAEFGFGFYRAGNLSRYFVFNARSGGLNDSILLPPIRGQLIDATCQFADNLIWVFMSIRESGNNINRCFLLSSQGGIIATTETTSDDGSWLGSIRGKTAIGKFLLAPTDDGIVRVEVNGTALSVAKEFPDTARFIDSGSRLFPGTNGLSVVTPKEIWNLQLK